MSKIGIMGGTFNPIHNGHIKLATAAMKELGLDKVWFMPSKNPPHKLNKNIASEEHRVAMIQLAIKSYVDFELSTLELHREGTTYTSDTLEELHKLYPEDKFYFIIGADSLVNIEKWHKPEVLFKLTTFVVASRDNVDKDILSQHCKYLESKYEDVDIKVLNMNKISVSSTELRSKCSIYIDGKLDNMDQNVYRYIMSHDIYKK